MSDTAAAFDETHNRISMHYFPAGSTFTFDERNHPFTIDGHPPGRSFPVSPATTRTVTVSDHPDLVAWINGHFAAGRSVRLECGRFTGIVLYGALMQCVPLAEVAA